MSKVQCTFRLPQQVVEFIDGQVGKDRTEKLLYLLGYEPELPEHIVMHGVMHRFDELEKRISHLESNGKVSSGKSTNRSANEDRRLSAIERLKSELNSIDKSDYDLIRSARYPLSEVRKRTTITKGQSDSYRDIIFKFFDIN